MPPQYENLPVYKAALDLTIHLEGAVRGFEKYNKYVIGTRLRELAHDILLRIARANRITNRNENLMEALDKLQDLRIAVHVCKEIKAFRSFKSFEFVIRSVENIAKQCEGWWKSQNR